MELCRRCGSRCSLFSSYTLDCLCFSLQTLIFPEAASCLTYAVIITDTVPFHTCWFLTKIKGMVPQKITYNVHRVLQTPDVVYRPRRVWMLLYFRTGAVRLTSLTYKYPQTFSQTTSSSSLKWSRHVDVV